MRTISLMELRRHPGELVDVVRLTGESLLLERSGRPVAMLTPCTGGEAGGETGSARLAVQQKRLQALARLAGCGAATPRAESPGAWVAAERDGWE